MNWSELSEMWAVLALAVIAGMSIVYLGAEGGKEVALAIGGGLGGYLTKAAVNAAKTGKEEPKA